ncbi:Uncharacterized protein Adt_13968 [Abeliophyllum distichum]|uniref:Transposase (putative) gypsy type domain-containing protein n=1 Tax=Abeliophyllum distichum TaxID=126358 RepID=A0ABD1TYB7_9LAMI
MSMNSGSSEPSGAVVVMSSREVSLELVEVLPIQGIDTCTREKIHIARVSTNIHFHVSESHERACAPRKGCIALHIQSFNVGMRLSLDPFYRRFSKTYGLTPTQVAPNGWNQMAGSLYLWFWHSIRFEIPLHMFQMVYLLKKLPRKNDREEEVGWYYFGPWGPINPSS